MLWDILQQGQIEENRADIRRVGRQSEDGDYDLEKRLRQTADRLEALMICCQAMWEILGGEAGVGEEALLAKIKEVDMRSGRRDGKMPAKAAVRCECGRDNSPRHKLCLYCGRYLDKADDPHVFHIP